MKKIISRIKPYLRWLILGATLFFLLKTLKQHWQEIAAIRIDNYGWLMLVIAFLFTFLAHCWAAWVWIWILKLFKQPISPWWGIKVYLITNIGKYLPGNVWHFYGRISAISKAGASIGVASLSVLLEPLLMAASAFIIALMGNRNLWGLQIIGLIIVLLGIHPYILNQGIKLLSRIKGNPTEVEIKQYPWIPLLGELGFLLLRGTGFLFAMMALISINLNQVPLLLSVFSFAWLLGLIVPGAPGGLGVFEATAIATLDHTTFPPGIVLSVVALFRVVSISAEAIAAFFAWLTKGS